MLEPEKISSSNDIFLVSLKFYKDLLEQIKQQLQQLLKQADDKLAPDYKKLNENTNDYSEISQKVIIHNAKLQIYNWKRKVLKLEQQKINLLKKAPDLLKRLNDANLAMDLVNKRPSNIFKRWAIAKWLGKNYKAEYEKWKKIKDKLKDNLIEQKKADPKTKSINPSDYINNNKLKEWNKKVRVIINKVKSLQAQMKNQVYDFQEKGINLETTGMHEEIYGPLYVNETLVKKINESLESFKGEITELLVKFLSEENILEIFSEYDSQINKSNIQGFKAVKAIFINLQIKLKNIETIYKNDVYDKILKNVSVQQKEIENQIELVNKNQLNLKEIEIREVWYLQAKVDNFEKIQDIQSQEKQLKTDELDAEVAMNASEKIITDRFTKLQEETDLIEKSLTDIQTEVKKNHKFLHHDAGELAKNINQKYIFFFQSVKEKLLDEVDVIKFLTLSTDITKEQKKSEQIKAKIKKESDKINQKVSERVARKEIDLENSKNTESKKVKKFRLNKIKNPCKKTLISLENLIIEEQQVSENEENAGNIYQKSSNEVSFNFFDKVAATYKWDSFISIENKEGNVLASGNETIYGNTHREDQTDNMHVLSSGDDSASNNNFENVFSDETTKQVNAQDVNNSCQDKNMVKQILIKNF